MFNLVLNDMKKSYERKSCYKKSGRPCWWEDVISLTKYSVRVWTEYVWLRIGYGCGYELLGLVNLGIF